MRILKWTLELQDVQEFRVPEGATPLSVQLQGNSVSLWMLCDESAEARVFRVVRAVTGMSLGDEPGNLMKMYIGTIQLCDGKVVYHFFGGFVE